MASPSVSRLIYKYALLRDGTFPVPPRAVSVHPSSSSSGRGLKGGIRRHGPLIVIPLVIYILLLGDRPLRRDVYTTQRRKFCHELAVKSVGCQVATIHHTAVHSTGQRQPLTTFKDCSPSAAPCHVSLGADQGLLVVLER